MSAKGNKGAKSILEGKQIFQGQPLLQIDPPPKRRGTKKACRDLRINPEIYPLLVVETATRLIDPRDFEVSWESKQNAGNIAVTISAKSYEHDAEYLEYYFYRKLILASTTHHAQQRHAEIRTLFMQSAYNVTRQTWQTLGWEDAFAVSTTEAKEAEVAAEAVQTHEYKDISYVVDEADKKLYLIVETGVYGLPDILSAAAETRRTGWEVRVDARSASIRVAVKLKENDVKTIVTQFHQNLETTAASVLCPIVAEDVEEDSLLRGQTEQMANQKVDVDVYPQIFPLSTIQLAALLVSDRLYVKIDGDPEKRIIVNLKSKSLATLAHVESIFCEALIQASLDEYKLASYESIRSYFLKLALSFGAVLESVPFSTFFRMQKPNRQKLDYQMSVNGSEIHLSVSGRKSARISLFDVVWRLRRKGSFVFNPEGSDKICVKIQPKEHVQIEALKKELNRELQRNHMF